MHPTHQLLIDLETLGLDASNHTALLLLPLVEVAWTDGKIQHEEKKAILAFGVNNRFLGLDSEAIVEGWMEKRPSDAYFQRGLDVLVRLAHCRDGLQVSPSRLTLAIDYCTVVGQAASSLFHRSGNPNLAAKEQQAIDRINEVVARLEQDHGPRDGVYGSPITPDWQALLDDLRGEFSRHDFAVG